jgi:hypothetical protein
MIFHIFVLLKAIVTLMSGVLFIFEYLVGNTAWNILDSLCFWKERREGRKKNPYPTKNKSRNKNYYRPSLEQMSVKDMKSEQCPADWCGVASTKSKCRRAVHKEAHACRVQPLSIIPFQLPCWCLTNKDQPCSLQGCFGLRQGVSAVLLLVHYRTPMCVSCTQVWPSHS